MNPEKNELLMESLFKCKEEMKRVDHLIYVSLKYTRTVDIMKHIIERLVNACDNLFELLLAYLKQKKKIKEIPEKPIFKCKKIEEIFKEDLLIMELCEFYLLLRKLAIAKYKSSMEFRRNVTMTAQLDDKEFELNINKIYEMHEKMKSFISHAEELVGFVQNG